MFQDVRPKRSLKDILPNKHQSRRPAVKKEPAEEAGQQDFPPAGGATGRRSFRLVSLLVSLAAAGALLYLGSGFFAAAVVEIVPKQESMVFDETFDAAKAPAEGAALTYEVTATEWKKVSRTVPATAREKISRPASGRIVIYNNFGKAPFELVANTRFEAPGGKIFRIKERVVIPGQKTEGNKTVPGSVEAAVFAAEPGAGYNLGLVDLTVPGLRNSPSFEKIYARAKTPLTGGFAGEIKTIPQAEEEKIRKELDESLRRDLLETARFQIPADFILYDGAVIAAFQANQPTATSSTGQGDNAVIEESGQLKGIIFNRRQLADFLLKKNAPNFAGESADIQGLDQLKLTILTKIPEALEELKKASFRLEGSAKAVGVIPAEALQTKLAGLKRTEVKAVLQEFPLIDSAKVNLRPPWWTRLPDEPAKIRIKVISADSS